MKKSRNYKLGSRKWFFPPSSALLFSTLAFLLSTLAASAQSQTFVSSINGRASSGGGNATVPNDAPIQPPQAFVDMNLRFVDAEYGYTTIDLSDLGITSISSAQGCIYDQNQVAISMYGRVGGVVSGAFGNEYTLSFAGNHLAAASINQLLHECVLMDLDWGPNLGIILDLSGGTNAAPTGQGITDKNTLIANGWTVTTNSTPSNTALPAISGGLASGGTLTSTTGTWTGTATISYGYQWRRCDAGGANCSNVGANQNTYVTGAGDIGSTIRVIVTATNAFGSVSATSTQTGLITL